MRAGNLRHLLRLEAPDLVVEETGGLEPTPTAPSGWKFLGEVWAEVKDASARERFIVGQLASEATTSVTIRDHEKVDATCRFIHAPNGWARSARRALHVVGPPIRDGRNRQMTLTCTEKSL